MYLSGALFLGVGTVVLSEQSTLRSHGPVEYSTVLTCQQALQNSPCVRTQWNVSYGGEVRISGSGGGDAASAVPVAVAVSLTACVCVCVRVFVCAGGVGGPGGAQAAQPTVRAAAL